MASDRTEPPKPNEIKLDIDNRSAQFTVKYNTSPGTVWFPFTSTDISDLVFSAEVLNVHYDNAQTGADWRSVIQKWAGQFVNVAYIIQKDVQTISGILINSTDEIVVVNSQNGTVMLKAPFVASITNPNASAYPSLVYNLVNIFSTNPVYVKGNDSQFSYTVRHAITLEPMVGDSDAGKCKTIINTQFSISNEYDWPVNANSLTLTEYKPTVFEERNVSRAALSSATRETTSHELGQHNSYTYDGSVLLQPKSTGPTIVVCPPIEIVKSKWHLIGSCDPTILPPLEKQLPLNFAVRIHRNVDKFMFSGPATIGIDLDPVPGPDSQTVSMISRDVFYDAWDNKNSSRMYYNVGQTGLFAVTQIAERGASVDHVRLEDGSYSARAILEYENYTAYTAPIKLWLRGQGENVIKTVVTRPYSVVTDDEKPPVLVVEPRYVRELSDDQIEQETFTLMAHIPPTVRDGQKHKYVVTLEVTYYKRK